MPLTQLIVLAIVQGITEFLPVSSSGHISLLQMFTGLPAQNLTLDFAVRVGTFLAVCAYFWRDLGAMIVGLWRLLRGKRDPGARLALQIIVASIPALAAVWAFDKYVSSDMNQLTTIGWTTVGYALVLLIVDKACMTIKRVEHAPYGDVILLGLAQILALVPGTSRIGITISMARLLGYERAEAARFSMLLSMPMLLASAAWLGFKLESADELALSQDVALVMAISFVAGLLAIAAMMAWLRRSTFTPFVIYRLILGGGLLAVAYGYIQF